jgi:4-hydroxy-tetrahydrodipicolinate synthase
MKRDIRGVGVALVTPFDGRGAVDYEALGRVVDFVTDGGVDYLVALGTTAETPTLQMAEKQDVARFIMERNAGRLPVVVGCGGYDTEEVAANLKRLPTEDADAVLCVTPYYNKPSQEGLYRHFRRVADESPAPVILYNVPSRTGVNMAAKTSLRLARDSRNILGIKEACGVMGQIMELLCGRPEGFRVISGDDVLALPLMAVGGDGVISVAANAFPVQMSLIMRAVGAGDFAEAARVNRLLHPAVEALFSEGSPTGVKTALVARGIVEPNLRLPMIAGSDDLLRFFKEYIAAE